MQYRKEEPGLVGPTKRRIVSVHRYEAGRLLGGLESVVPVWSRQEGVNQAVAVVAEPLIHSLREYVEKPTYNGKNLELIVSGLTLTLLQQAEMAGNQEQTANSIRAERPLIPSGVPVCARIDGGTSIIHAQKVPLRYRTGDGQTVL